MNYTLFLDVWVSALNANSRQALHDLWAPYDVATPETLDTIYDMACGGIRKIREAIGLSRISFSESYGISCRTIEDWEAGRRTPPAYINTLLAYAVLTDVLAMRKEFVPVHTRPLSPETSL